MRFFFFKRKKGYEMRMSDWSSDVCSSDLHAAQVVVVADAGKHQPGAVGGCPRRRHGGAAVLLHPGFGLGGGTVVDGHVVAGGGPVAGHGNAHDPPTEEGGLGHLRSEGRRGGAEWARTCRSRG